MRNRIIENQRDKHTEIQRQTENGENRIKILRKETFIRRRIRKKNIVESLSQMKTILCYDDVCSFLLLVSFSEKQGWGSGTEKN